MASPDLPQVVAPKTVPEVVSAMREVQGMSLRAFADELQVSHNTVAQWERGVAEPEISRLAVWFNDIRPWVHELAVEIFVARYRATLLEQYRANSRPLSALS